MSIHDGKWTAALVGGVLLPTHQEFIKQLPIGRILLYIKEYDDAGKRECKIGFGEEQGTTYVELTRRGFAVIEVDGCFLVRW
jgi:hypothetical protein